MTRDHSEALLAATHGYTVARAEPSRNARRWAATAPLRFYLRHSPLKRGKGLVQRVVLRACMAEPEALDISLPCGAQLQISTSEIIGQHLAIYGEFERAELAACSRLARRGTAAFDVGANVGLFTLTMSVAVGDTGRVFAFEPLQHNFLRLRSNIARNCLANVEVVAVAAGAAHGIAHLSSALDPAYVAARAVAANSHVASATVPMVTLDEVWERSGRPEVSLVKIDVEGSEPEVIAGASALLAMSRPRVLVEAPNDALLQQVTSALAEFGFKPTQPSGFAPWNYLFGA